MLDAAKRSVMNGLDRSECEKRVFVAMLQGLSKFEVSSGLRNLVGSTSNIADYDGILRETLKLSPVRRAIL
jgi:hypothetical protein